jgi:hypothetical protein
VVQNLENTCRGAKNAAACTFWVTPLPFPENNRRTTVLRLAAINLPR